MDWKRTMSKGSLAASEAILNHAEGLAEELNLRLLCNRESGTGYTNDPQLLKLLLLSGNKNLWKELCLAGNILWVEKVEVTVNY